jgi:hypothetical protein
MADDTASSAGRARLTRRRFLIGGALTVVALGALAGALAGRPVLAAVVDTIVPADEFGPAASQTGAVEALWAQLEGTPVEQLRLRLVLGWLNLRAGGSFAAAGEAERTALLHAMAEKPAGDPRRRVYEWVRTRTLRHYYGSAARARALGFVGPPQPRGYPDAASPWKASS